MYARTHLEHNSLTTPAMPIRRRCVVRLVVVQAAAMTVAGVWLKCVEWPTIATVWLCVFEPILGAQACLMGVWLAIGSRPIWQRVLLTTLAIGSLWPIGVITAGLRPGSFDRARLAIMLGVGAFGTMALTKLCRYRIERQATPQMNEPGFHVSIAQILIMTTMIALVFGIKQFVDLLDLRLGTIIALESFAAPICSAATAVILLRGILANANVWYSSFLAALSVSAVALIPAFYLNGISDADDLRWSLLLFEVPQLVVASSVSSALLDLRLGGYRLK